MASGSSVAPPNPITCFFHLLPVMVTRGPERDGDSVQFITTMEKPSHLSSWQQAGLLLHLEGQQALLPTVLFNAGEAQSTQYLPCVDEALSFFCWQHPHGQW